MKNTLPQGSPKTLDTRPVVINNMSDLESAERRLRNNEAAGMDLEVEIHRLERELSKLRTRLADRNFNIAKLSKAINTARGVES